MRLNNLVHSSLTLIREQLNWARNPCVLSSFGKDSQVLLWMVRQIQPKVRVIYFRGFEHSTKHSFMHRMVEEWGLDCAIPVPLSRDAIVKDSHAEVIELYELAPDRLMYFPIEAEVNYIPDEKCDCAIEKLSDLTWKGQNFKFDAAFIGHRNDDVDPTLGPVPLKDYVAESENGDFRYVYPLKDWTEEDIWEVSRWQNIPQNEARYKDGDMSQNNDYYPMCTNCLRNDEAEVFCPRAGINRRAFKFDPGAADEWRKRAVNLADTA